MRYAKDGVVCSRGCLLAITGGCATETLEFRRPLDGLVSSKERAVLSGRPATLHLMNGAVITEIRIIDFIHGRDGQSIEFVQYADGARQAKKRASDIYRMQIGGTPYTLRYNVPTDGFYLTHLLVSYLIGQNSKAFSQFFEDVKLGQTWEDALATNYGVTPQQLAASFGRTVGVLNVTP